MSKVSPLWHRFPTPNIFEVEGRDALRYLNARLTNDIRTVTVQRGVGAAALTPVGRVEGLFSVVKHLSKDNCYYLWCTGGDRETVKKAFTRYIVADRVSVRDVSEEYALIHLFSVDEINEGKSLYTTVVEDGAYHFSFPRIGNYGVDLLLPSSLTETYIKKYNLTDERQRSSEQWNVTRARYGMPSFPEEIDDSVLLSETTLTNVVSYNKGCYTGQEVVEKIDARGKAPRIIVRYVAKSGGGEAFPKETPLLSGEESAGTIVSSWCDQAQIVGFALLKAKYRGQQINPSVKGNSVELKEL